MKLTTFIHDNKQQIGAINGQCLTPVDAQGPDNLIDFFKSGHETKARLNDRVISAKHSIDLQEVTLKAPIPRPPKFFGVALNYTDHIAETRLPRPEYPTVFNKQSTCIIGHGEAIHRPNISKKLDYEGELGVVIGRAGRHVAKKDAGKIIAGYTICNDVSVRDWQARSHTWTLGKSFDTHGPVGPWVVTPEEIGDPHRLDIKTWVNGELRQSSNTRYLLFDCYYLIEYLSTVMTLEPGDIIATGTSSGVGVKMVPRNYLKPGDIVRIEIEKIGILENPVIEEPGDSAFID